MERWVLFSILSMLFAGVTSILAKFGMEDVSAETALAVRISVIFLLILLVTSVDGSIRDFSALSRVQLGFLVLSGVTTTLSWLFYYKAMKDGLVSYVATIDKASIVITLLLSFWLLKEPITPKILMGMGLVTAGLVVLVWK